MGKHFTLPYDGGLIEKNLPAGILHTYEKIWTHVYPESRPASYAIADIIVDAINAHKDTTELTAIARRHGMRTLREDGLRKAAAGTTTVSEVLAVTVGDEE